MRIPVLAALATMCLATPPALSQQVTTRPDRSWLQGTIRSQDGGELVLEVGITPVQGRIAVCGTGFTPKTHAGHQRLIPGIIADLRISLGPVQLLHQAEDFRIYATEAEMRAGRAGCTLTRHAADPTLLQQPLRIEARRGYATDW